MKEITDIKEIDVLNFLPQREPFVLIDRLISYDSQTTSVVSYYKIKPNSTFVDGDTFQAAGLVENIAQTCAARIGYIDWLNDNPIKIGVIGSVKNMRVYSLPKVYDEIYTTIELKSEIMGVSLVKAVVKDILHNLMAVCEMKIAIQD